MNFVCIGKLINTHGIKGEVRIISDFKYKDIVFKKGNSIIIDKISYEIVSYRKHKNYDMLMLLGINSINEAELLKDKLEYKYKLKRIESLIVIANPKTIIDKTYAPQEISNRIIRHDQLINLISNVEKNKKIDWVFIEDDMMNISKCLLEHHKEIDLDYVSKYSLDNIETMENINLVNTDEIRKNLKEFRLNKSKEENIKAYMVFNNETMEEIINLMPKNTEELQMVKGFGPIKTKKYGEDILNIIKEN